MPFAIRTYVGQDEWGNKKCLAHMNFGNDTYMSFFGPTEEAAKATALNWYEAERLKWGKIDASGASDLAASPEKPTSIDGWGSGFKNPSGQTHHFAGKVWMLNRDNHKVRVDAAEQASYEAKGYVKGGPRSQWKE